MQWEQEYSHSPQYEYVSTNQHGDRFKRSRSKRISIAILTAETTDVVGLSRLILLSHHLDVPVRYDFKTDPHTAYIKVVGKEAL